LHCFLFIVLFATHHNKAIINIRNKKIQITLELGGGIMSRYKFQLKNIKVNSIMLNPNNPRGESVRDNDDQFQYLKRSIKEYGLLVPIVVQKSRNSNNEYILLDGERRYYALKELGIDEVPAHVLDNNIKDDQSKNLMFHIHTTRLQWEPYQQCKALEILYEDLKTQFKGNENNIAKQMIILTGTNQSTVKSRLNFLRWPEDIKKVVYYQRPELYYTIVEIEGQIIVPAMKNFPDYFQNVKVDDVRKFLFNKYMKGIISKATEARKVTLILNTSRTDKEKYNYAFKLFKTLVSKADYTFEDVRDEFLAKYPNEDKETDKTFQKKALNINRAKQAVEDINAMDFANFTKQQRQKLLLLLTTLQMQINKALQRAEDFDAKL